MSNNSQIRRNKLNRKRKRKLKLRKFRESYLLSTSKTEKDKVIKRIRWIYPFVSEEEFLKPIPEIERID